MGGSVSVHVCVCETVSAGIHYSLQGSCVYNSFLSLSLLCLPSDLSDWIVAESPRLLT